MPANHRKDFPHVCSLLAVGCGHVRRRAYVQIEYGVLPRGRADRCSLTATASITGSIMYAWRGCKKAPIKEVKTRIELEMAGVAQTQLEPPIEQPATW